MNPETLDARFLRALLFLRFEFDEKAFLRSRRLLLSYRSLGPDILRCRGATHLKSVLLSFRHASWRVHTDPFRAFSSYCSGHKIGRQLFRRYRQQNCRSHVFWRAASMSPIDLSSSISHASLGSRFLNHMRLASTPRATYAPAWMQVVQARTLPPALSVPGRGAQGLLHRASASVPLKATRRLRASGKPAGSRPPVRDAREGPQRLGEVYDNCGCDRVHKTSLT